MKKIINQQSKNNKSLRNILLIGSTGNGKSTLANVLLNRDNNFEEVFKESAKASSETKKVKKEQFDFENKNYCIIDTIGIGDTKLSKEEVLLKLKDVSDETDDFGLNQILFVTNGRITKEEVENYDLLKEVIFDGNVEKYTTIVRTNFPNFRNKTKCDEDVQEMKSRDENDRLNERLIKMIDSCNKIIHASNPPINTAIADDESDSERENRENLINSNKRTRNKSREKLLNHLKTCDNIYQPELLGKFHKIIDDFDLLVRKIATIVNDNHDIFISNVEKVDNFINERRKIIKEIEVNKEKLDNREKTRVSTNNWGNSAIIAGSVASGVGLLITAPVVAPVALVGGVAAAVSGWGMNVASNITAGVSENKHYNSFQKNIEKDENNVKSLSSSWKELAEANKKFREEKTNEINSSFSSSEYIGKEINKEKIEALKRVKDKIIEAKTSTNENLSNKKELNYSGWSVVGRNTLEFVLGGAPTSIYCLFRDNRETRSSSSDMKETIDGLKGKLSGWETRKEWLNRELEKYKYCQSEIAKIPLNEKAEEIYQTNIEQPPK